MDEATREYLDAINNMVGNTTSQQPPLLDEVVWMEMYKAFVNWHAVSRTPGIIYSDSADKALLEFRKRFRN